MKYLKRFNESTSSRYVLVTYNKFIDGYPETTAIIVDSNNNIVDHIDFVFGKDGEYSPEAKDKMNQYNISGKSIGDSKDLYMVNNSEKIDPEEVLHNYVEEVKTTKSVDKFLTPEKQKSLINLFRKRRKR